MGTTSWAIGSNPSVGAVSITFDAGSGEDTQDIISAQQAMYLYDAGSSFDALKLLENALEAYALDTVNFSVVLTRDRKVRIDNLSSAYIEIVSWDGVGADAFQEMLGFDGAEIAVHNGDPVIAAEVSPYLWSPNKTETPDARVGEDGIPYYDTAVGMSGTRVVVATNNNSGKINGFRWPAVENARYWPAAETSGCYYVWHDYVQRRFRRFKIWREVNELDGSTDAATLSAKIPSSGAYVYRWDGDGPLTFPMSRDIPELEYLHTVDLPVVLTDEYE